MTTPRPEPALGHTSWLITQMQRSPHLRSALYLGSMAALLAAARVLNQRLVTDPESIWYGDMNTTVLPAALAVTYAFARLRPEDQSNWERTPTKAELGQLGQGLLMGGAAMAAVLGTAAAKGWISAPSWGWDQVPFSVLLQTVASQIVKYTAAAWEEEMVFRGYGFDALRQAVGPIAATIVSSALFARYHGPLEPHDLAAMALGGVMFTLLRLQHESLWLPFGFHLAWNLIQVIVFGPKAGPPSIRPIELHGPTAWIGTPGVPEPGILSMAAVALVIVISAFQLRRVLRATSARATSGHD